MRIATVLAIVVAGALLAAGCRAPLEGAPCPCVSGYDCNAENVCVLATGGSGSDASSEDDAGDGDGDGDIDAAEGVPDASIDGGGGKPDAADLPDSGGGEPDGGGGSDASLAAWYEQ